MSLIKVFHAHLAGAHAGRYHHIANARINKAGLADDEKLECAFRWTNNVYGMWSRQDPDQPFEKELGEPDRNIDILVAPVIVNNRTFLHRSTTSGDIMVMNGKMYLVGVFGFSLVPDMDVAGYLDQGITLDDDEPKASRQDAA